MSYSVWLEIDTGGDEPATVWDGWDYTSNCSPIWRAAGADLAEFHDKPAGECAPILRDALKVLRADPERFREMNPPNGWGSYDSLLPALERLACAFRDYPKATVEVWR